MNYLLLYVVLCLLNLADFYLTSRILTHGGFEDNPLQAYMIDAYGHIGILYTKVPLLVVLGLLLVSSPYKAWITSTLMTANIIYAIVLVWSMYVLYVVV